MKNQTTFGHVAVIFTNIVWGTTFISTKLLLEYFDPIEILFIRTVIGFLALCAAYPHRMKITDRKQELIFALAGLTGSCMYFLLENIALTYTMASNVGVILAVAPCFTAMMMHLFFRGEEKLQWNFFAGFLVAMIGICFISPFFFQGIVDAKKDKRNELFQSLIFCADTAVLSHYISGSLPGKCHTL